MRERTLHVMAALGAVVAGLAAALVLSSPAMASSTTGHGSLSTESEWHFSTASEWHVGTASEWH